MKIVVGGSFKDLTLVRQKLQEFQAAGHEVFPTEEHLRESEPLVAIHNTDVPDTHETYVRRHQVVMRFLEHLREADLFYVVNERDGWEHIGRSVALELGIAYSLGIRVQFYRPLTDVGLIAVFWGRDRSLSGNGWWERDENTGH